MAIKVILNKDQIDHAIWSDFVLRNPNGSIFQTPEMFKFWQDLEDHIPLGCWAFDEHKNLVGILTGVIMTSPGIKGKFSRRCIIFGGPVIAESCDVNCYSKILTGFNNQAADQAIYTELRCLFSYEDQKNIFNDAGYKYLTHLNFKVNLDNQQLIKTKISKSRWRQIQKSLKNGARIIEPNSIDQIFAFYEILENLYKTKVKKPLPAWPFFKKFYQHPELGRFLLIEYNEKVVAGIMCPIYKKTIYEWYIGGLDRQYDNIYPSILATWAAIDFGFRNNLKIFDFMGAGRPDDAYGVREFKAKFGGELVEYGRYLQINKPVLYHIGKLGLKFQQTLN